MKIERQKHFEKAQKTLSNAEINVKHQQRPAAVYTLLPSLFPTRDESKYRVNHSVDEKLYRMKCN